MMNDGRREVRRRKPTFNYFDRDRMAAPEAMLDFKCLMKRAANMST